MKAKYYKVRNFTSIFKIVNESVFYNDENNEWCILPGLRVDNITLRPDAQLIKSKDYKLYPIVVEEIKEDFYVEVLSNKSE